MRFNLASFIGRPESLASKLLPSTKPIPPQRDRSIEPTQLHCLRPTKPPAPNAGGNGASQTIRGH